MNMSAKKESKLDDVLPASLRSLLTGKEGCDSQGLTKLMRDMEQELNWDIVSSQNEQGGYSLKFCDRNEHSTGKKKTVKVDVLPLLDDAPVSAPTTDQLRPEQPHARRSTSRGPATSASSATPRPSSSKASTRSYRPEASPSRQSAKPAAFSTSRQPVQAPQLPAVPDSGARRDIPALGRRVNTEDGDDTSLDPQAFHDEEDGMDESVTQPHPSTSRAPSQKTVSKDLRRSISARSQSWSPTAGTKSKASIAPARQPSQRQQTLPAAKQPSQKYQIVDDPSTGRGRRAMLVVVLSGDSRDLMEISDQVEELCEQKGVTVRVNTPTHIAPHDNDEN